MMIFLLLTFCLHASAEDFRTLYDQGRYPEAIDSLKNAGLNDYSDYYNLANSYYKSGKPQIAYAYYQKALSLSPANEDIKYNLALTESVLEKNGLLSRDLSLWRGKIIPLSRGIGITIPLILTLILNILLIVFLMRLKRNPRESLVRAVIGESRITALLIVWLLLVPPSLATIKANTVKLSAVISESVTARSGPSDDFTELFKLSAGALVENTGEKRNQWTQIRFSIGNVGWIMEKDLIEL